MAMASKKREKVSEEVVVTEEKVVVPPPGLEQQILNVLGTPPNFYKLQLVTVGEQRVRANVRCFVPSNNSVQVTTIAHSYFLKLNDKGLIVGGDPISKLYN